MRDLTDSEGLRALKWSFLFLGRAWDGAHEKVWPYYAAAALARQEGERDYSAEARLFELMPLLGRRPLLGQGAFAVPMRRSTPHFRRPIASFTTGST